MEGLMNPKNPKNLSDFPNKFLNDVQTSQIDVSPSTFFQELKYAKWVLLSHEVLHAFNLQFFTHGVGGKDEGIIGHI